VKRPISFGKYFLLERVNVGGMAEVFKAKTYGVEGFERLLAVKKILPNIAEDEEFISMFIDEAKIAVQLNHANIAQIFDLGKVDESYFIALEYIHGKDLRAIFDRCMSLTETMPIPQSVFIIMKVCEGLDYAHNKRDSGGREMHLVHRDVSPQNVLISYEGEVKLVDFGIAKAAGKASKTQAGILKGKFGYMSPEQVRGLPLDRKSDIFSVGIVLYELLTGERLFQGESDFSTLEKVRNVEILPPTTYNRKIQEELEQIVLKALAKDVEDRYQNAIDLHDDLQAFLYTSGAFYSRKDLALWMKKTFAREIEEESRKMEEYRHMPVPPFAKPQPPPPPSAAGAKVRPPPPPGPLGGNGKRGPGGVPRQTPMPDRARSLSPLMTGPLPVVADVPQREKGPPTPGLTWDDDEVETQIYDKPEDMPEEVRAQGIEEDLLTDPSSPAVATQPPSGMAFPPLPSSEPRPLPKMPESSPELARLHDPARITGPVAMGPGFKTGAGLRPQTVQVTPMPIVVPRAHAKEAKKSKLALLLAIAFLTVVLCVGALYYFFILSKKPGSIQIVAVPSDVTVYLDGKQQPWTGTPHTIHSLKPGFYILAATKVGYERWTKTVEVKAGEATQANPQLEMLASAGVELHTNPRGGEAFLDGRKLEGKTPMKISRITPGKHRIEVKVPAFQVWNHEFEIEADQTLKLLAKLLPLEVKLNVTSTPSAEVFLVQEGQRESKGMTPVEIKLVPKSPTMVVLHKEGYKEVTRPVAFEGGDGPIRIEAALEKESKTAPKIDLPPPKKVEPAVVVPPKKAEPAVRPAPKKIEPAVVRPAPKKVEPIAVEPVTKKGGRKGKKGKAGGGGEEPAVVAPKPKGGGEMGTLLINTKPWTYITIDGKETGLTTPQKVPLSVGKHVITLRNPKFKIEETFPVDIKLDGPNKVVKNFPVETP
jgi:eukaryotic-like serine/threonine-protein kinase